MVCVYMYIIYTPRMENQMEKNMETEMETAIYRFIVIYGLYKL